MENMRVLIGHVTLVSVGIANTVLIISGNMRTCVV